MEIIDLKPEYENTYFCCLEEWSDEIKEAGNHKACWYKSMKDKGLRVKLASDDDGKICGMIQYLPVEASMFDGSGLHVILCIWVHGHKQGVGNRQKKGIGTSLLNAAEEDARALGSNGIVAWGIWLPFFMRAAWFRKHGYKTVEKDGMIRLLWKPFNSEAVEPSFIKRKKLPELIKNKVNVFLFLNGWCPAQNTVYERMRRAITGYEDYVILREYNTIDKSIQREWGIADGVFLDNKEIRNGPPTPYKVIRKKLDKKVRKLQS